MRENDSGFGREKMILDLTRENDSGCGREKMILDVDERK